MQLTLQQLTAELRTFCQEGRSGAFRITTNTNHTAQFCLDAGRIVGARYRIKRGVAALELIKRIQMGQSSFEEGQPNPADTSLPSTEGIFAQLEQAAGVAAPAASDTPAAPSAPAAEFSQAVKVTLEDVLTEYIGPMAGIVCRNVFSQAASLGEAIELLKAKIPDASRAAQFEREVMSRTLA